MTTTAKLKPAPEPKKKSRTVEREGVLWMIRRICNEELESACSSYEKHVIEHLRGRMESGLDGL